MGNTQTNKNSSLDDWQPLNTQNGFQIFKNKNNNQLAQKRFISIDPQYDLNDEIKIYKMRQNNNQSLVKTYAVQNILKKKSSQGLCSSVNRVSVLFEKMPYRLSQLPQLTFPQSLLFLKESIKGYSKIYKNYGPIHITSNLIGINSNGQVKVWVNENWANNHPNHELPTLRSTMLQDLSKQQYLAYGAIYRDQTQMVHNLLAVIEQKCQQGKYPKAFGQQVQTNSSTFKKLDTYLDQFIHYNNLFIPHKINYETVFVSKYQKRLNEQRQNNNINNTNIKIIRDQIQNQNQQNIILNNNLSSNIVNNIKKQDNKLYGYQAQIKKSEINFNSNNKFNTKNNFNTHTSFIQPQSFISRPSQTFGTINNAQIYSTNNNLGSTYLNSTNNFNIKPTIGNESYNVSFNKNNLNTWQPSISTNYQSNTFGNKNYQISSYKPTNYTLGKQTQINKGFNQTNKRINSILGAHYLNYQTSPLFNKKQNFENIYQSNSFIYNKNQTNLNVRNPQEFISTKFHEYSALNAPQQSKLNYNFQKSTNLYEPSKFGQYQGSGYSNILSKYQIGQTKKFSNQIPSIKAAVSLNQVNSLNNYSQGHTIIHENNTNENKNSYEKSLQNLAKMVDRVSNQIDQSAIKQF